MDSTNNNAKEISIKYIERIEPLEKKKSEITHDITDILTEAKAQESIPSIIKQVARVREIDVNKGNEKEAFLSFAKVL